MMDFQNVIGTKGQRFMYTESDVDPTIQLPTMGEAVKLASIAKTQERKGKSRKRTITFRSVQDAEDKEIVLDAMRSKNLHRLIPVLLEYPKTRKWICSSLSNAVRKEVSSLLLAEKTVLYDDSVDAIQNFKFLDLDNIIRLHCPVLTAVLSAEEPSTEKFVTSASIILQQHTQQANILQYIIAINLYHNYIQKDGITFLNKLGISVSYASLNRKLNEAKVVPCKIMKRWRARVENSMNITSEPEQDVFIRDHSYHTADDINEQPTQQCVYAVDPEGYIIVMDNLDCLVHVRNMTLENQDREHHYINAIAVKDRVSFPHLDDNVPQAELRDIPNSQFLPSLEENETYKDDFVHQTAYIITKHMPSFNRLFWGLAPRYFKHEYSAQMSKKSEIVTLGVWDKDENHNKDVVEFSEDAQQFVPGVRSEEEIANVLEWEDRNPNMRPVPMLGDEKSCQRIRSAHGSRMQENTPEERLEGYFTSPLDFHEKMIFLAVIYHILMKDTSIREGGTLAQLRALINRMNVKMPVKHNYHATAGFFDFIFEMFVVAAVMVLCKMSKPDDVPYFYDDLIDAPKEEKKQFLGKMCSKIVNKHVFHNLTETIGPIADGQIADSPISDKDQEDGVLRYAELVLMYGYMRAVCVTTTKSGDGNRAARNWKYNMLVFNDTHHTNYRLEGFLFQAIIQAQLPARKAKELLYQRYINYTGGEGKCEDADYVLELINGMLRRRINRLNSNHTPETVDRLGKTLMFLKDLNRTLKEETKTLRKEGRRKGKCLQKDRDMVLNQLVNVSKVFVHFPGRSYDSFPDMPKSIFQNTDIPKLHSYITGKKREFTGNKFAF